MRGFSTDPRNQAYDSQTPHGHLGFFAAVNTLVLLCASPAHRDQRLP